MAYQETLVGDTLNAGRIKINANLLELYSLSTVSVTAAASLDATALNKIHLCSGTSADYTVDLPTAVGNLGLIIFKGINALTKVVTIAGISAQTIDGEANRKISSCGMIAIMSDGSNWIVVGEVGSWITYTPTLTGFSALPTLDRSMYFRIGKMVEVQIHSSASGTSNATTKTITLPFIASGAAQAGIVASTVNSGVNSTSPGSVISRVDSDIADVYRTVASLAWTASGNARFAFSFTYVM